jgi:hypothetical protein
LKTVVEIDETDFLINGRKTYESHTDGQKRIEGLLLNSRMIQAIFDDECPATRRAWLYPDTGVWDPDRNTDEFCAMLPVYRNYGLLAVTVGLQGGGSIYTRPFYDEYLNSAFRPDGSLKSEYLKRLSRVIGATDSAGIVVIINFFYWRQERFHDDAAVKRATEEATQWILATGFRNVIVDVKNEVRETDGILSSRGIDSLIEIVRSTTLSNRRLLVGTSTLPKKHLPDGKWIDLVDLFLPHGNDIYPDAWRSSLRQLKASEPLVTRPRPICCNEDSIDLRNLEVSLEEGCSWGYYDQGFGCDEKQTKMDWTTRPRERRYEDLSGFQTVPVNWAVNTDHKRAFFQRLREVTGAA